MQNTTGSERKRMMGCKENKSTQRNTLRAGTQHTKEHNESRNTTQERTEREIRITTTEQEQNTQRNTASEREYRTRSNTMRTEKQQTKEHKSRNTTRAGTKGEQEHNNVCRESGEHHCEGIKCTELIVTPSPPLTHTGKGVMFCRTTDNISPQSWPSYLGILQVARGSDAPSRLMSC
jgi:hypothetical protein